jgi:putative salt-induced outer membrane protein
MMTKKSLAAASVALLVSGVAQSGDATGASSKTDAPAGTWAAQGQLGLIVTRADTNATSGNAMFAAAHTMGRWTLSGGLAALYARTGGTTTEQDLSANLQADLELSKRTFWFSTANYDRNLFTGFAYQESIASGGGFNFIQTEPTQLTGEIGVGYRRQQPEILVTNSNGGVTSRMRQAVVNDAVLQAAMKYQHSISSTTKLLNTLLVQYAPSDTTTTDNLSLQVKVDASLSLAVGAQLVNNTSPPPGSERHTDSVMTVNLVYELKNPNLSATGTKVTKDLSLP